MDRRARRLLLDTYWSAGGWKPEADQRIGPEDFEYAKHHGAMFDPISMPAEQLHLGVEVLLHGTTDRQVGSAFASSLTTRRCEWRSAMASRAHAELAKSGQRTCRAVGDMVDVDVNVMNFERIKWGGVRHDWLSYIHFDLSRFVVETISAPTLADVEVLRELLETIDNSESETRASQLVKDLSGLFPSNAVERRTVIEILACAGVLPGADRDETQRSDWRFAQPWRGCEGVDWDIADRYFGDLLGRG